MIIQEREQGETVVLSLQGRLDANTSGSLESAFAKLVEQGKGKFVFNLEGLEYVSSAGLRSLLSAAKTVKVIRGKLVLAHMNEHVREVFDMSGFSAIFTVMGTEAEAVQAMA
ncbi:MULTISPECIES: STAS domain-containing protein [Paenibacillus]|uniref:Anti-sigma factor antagonist n=1 Tax=Paenibacillus whitsoniae TaxID=2496558 RepID=A0A3S0I699_9BACL|nr:STAS domain-containing protein [Paenibacillus whitsoniae]RTE02437.1 anti-sigma factor antagonist [Paenibacillus whitsoniae]